MEVRCRWFDSGFAGAHDELRTLAEGLARFRSQGVLLSCQPLRSRSPLDLASPSRVDLVVARAGAGLRLPLLVVPAAGLYVVVGSPALYPSSKPLPVARALPMGVSASGRLAPEGEVIAVAPGSATDGGRVDRLLVAVGDRVQAGQVVAVLDTYRRRLAAVREAHAEVAVAQTKLAQVQAGPKAEDVRAHEAHIGRCQAELQAAERDLGRSALLLKKAAGSRQDFDDQNLKYQQARESLCQAKAELDALKAVRPADLRVAEAELAKAEASLDVAQADLRGYASTLTHRRPGLAHPVSARRTCRRKGNPRGR